MIAPRPMHRNDLIELLSGRLEYIHIVRARFMDRCLAMDGPKYGFCWRHLREEECTSLQDKSEYC